MYFDYGFALSVRPYKTDKDRMLQPHFCENADEPSRASSFRILILFVILFSIGLWSLSCTKPAAKDNLILITLDTQRADFISAYGTQNASTPNIDALAQRGVIYENCYTLIPITLPAHASIFFSQPPHEIKNYNNGQVIRQKKRGRPSPCCSKKAATPRQHSFLWES